MILISSVAIIQTRDKAWIASDSAVSANIRGKRYRINDQGQKLFHIDNSIIFCSGTMDISYEVIRQFKENSHRDLKTLSKISKDIFEKLSNSVDSPSLEIILLKKIKGRIYNYQISHYNNFEIKKNEVNDGVGVFTGGLKTQDALDFLCKRIMNNNSVNAIKDLTDVFSHLSCESIGGYLRIYEVDEDPKIIVEQKIDDSPSLLRMDVGFNCELVIAEMVLGKIILGQRVVIGDTIGVFTIEGSRLMIDDRCGRQVVKLGLLQENPDKFGLFINRYRSPNNCTDTTILNRTSVTADEGFVLERNRNGIFQKTFYTSSDGDLYMIGNFQAGEGEQIFKITHTGLQLGGSDWATAPLHADMYGNVWMNKLFADSAEIKNSLFKDGHIRGSDLELRDNKGGMIKMYPEYGLWFGAENFADAIASIAMDGTAKFKKLIVTDGNNLLLMDSDQRKIFMNNWDIIGAGAIDAQLLAASIVTAIDGFISNITADRLSTLTNAALNGWSNFIRIEGNTVKFITGKINGTGNQKTLPDGRPLYWVNSSQSGQMTTDVTAWPVMIYPMEDKEKMIFGFKGDGDAATPYIKMGIGDGGVGNSAIALIDKYQGGVKISYGAANTASERSIDLADAGITIKADGMGEVTINARNINIVATGKINISGTEYAFA